MALTYETCGAVILAGGTSRRMGQDKALLELAGESMVKRICRQLSPFKELLLSAGDPALSEGLPVRLVPDLYRNAGPLAGLHASLLASEKEALFCVSCDLPNYTPALAAFLMERFPEEADILVCRDQSGRVHPLCGIYTKRALPLLESQLKDGNYRVRTLLEKARCVYLDTGDYFPDSVFFNMNTPEDFQKAKEEKNRQG